VSTKPVGYNMYSPVIETKSRSPVGSAKQRLYNACEVRETVAHQEEPSSEQTKPAT